MTSCVNYSADKVKQLSSCQSYTCNTEEGDDDN